MKITGGKRKREEVVGEEGPVLKKQKTVEPGVGVEYKQFYENFDFCFENPNKSIECTLRTTYDLKGWCVIASNPVFVENYHVFYDTDVEFAGNRSSKEVFEMLKDVVVNGNDSVVSGLKYFYGSVDENEGRIIKEGQMPLGNDKYFVIGMILRNDVEIMLGDGTKGIGKEEILLPLRPVMKTEMEKYYLQTIENLLEMKSD